VTDARRDAAEDDVPEPFGDRLRRLRRAAGLSQSALAGGVVDASYVSLLESGRRAPTPPVLAALAVRLGVDVAELGGGPGHDLETVLVLAASATGLGRPADAVALLEPWRPHLTRERMAADPRAFRAGEAYATALESAGRVDDAVRVLENLCAATDSSPGRLPRLPVVIALSRCCRDVGDIARAIDVGEEGLRRVEGMRFGDVEGYAALVSTVAGAYAERGDLLRAQLLLEDLVARADAEGTDADRAAAYWNAALTAVERGRAGEGLRLVEQAAALLSDSADRRWRARIEVTRAWVRLAQDPPDAAGARALLRAALPQVRQYDGALTLASAESELARCELLLGRPEVARRHAVAALRGLDPSFRIERARALAALGAASVALGERAAGVESLESAADLLTVAEAPRQAAGVWRLLGEVYRSLGDPARALEAADRALDCLCVVREPIVAASPVPRGSGAGRARDRARS
jgi:tetratricopeptide (TPR) repeat protein